MPAVLERKLNRRRDRRRARNRVRPYLEQLEPRTVFAVGSAAFPAALAASQMGPFPAPGPTTTPPAQPAVFQGPTTNPAPAGAPAGPSPFASLTGGTLGAPFALGATTPGGAFQPGTLPTTTGAGPALSNGSTVLNGANPVALGQFGASGGGTLSPNGSNLIVIAPPLTTSLGQPLSSSSSPVIVIEPQVPTLSPATLSPEALPLSSSAPLTVLDPANYLLASGLNPAMRAGNLPSLLVTQTTETALEAGANSGGGGNNAINNGGGIIPAGVPLPDDSEQHQQIQEAIRFLASARRVAHDGDGGPDHGPAAPEGAAPLGEPQAGLAAEAPAAATSADGDW
jgi:hypothetical protein